jgi:hypothetical protein
MKHELLGRTLLLNPHRLTGWRVTSVQFAKVSVVSLATGIRHQVRVDELLDAITDRVLYVAD